MRFLREFGPSLAVAALLHAALGVFLVVSLERSVPAVPADAEPDAIEATVVDEALVEAELEKIRADERARAAALESQRQAADAAEARRAEEERRAQELQAQRERDARVAAAERDEREQAAAEAAAREQAERERLAELARQREAEEARLAELERQRQEAAERERRAEAERQEREAQARRERQAAAARQRALDEYRLSITLHVQRHWNQPENWPVGTSCTVRVSQIPSGEVVQVRIIESTGNEVLDRSVESAVLRASPLPLPSDPEVFSRDIEFVFRPVD